MAKKKSKLSLEQAQARLREVRREIDKIVRAGQFEQAIFESKEVSDLVTEEGELLMIVEAASPRPKPVNPPRSIKKFWLAPHCGPGSLDDREECGFCGAPHHECAERTSEIVREHPDWLHDGAIMGDGQDDPEDEMGCGGSGFWCSGCGRFWAQNSCGENFPGFMQSADGARQQIRCVVPNEEDGPKTVHCVCGKQLARVRTEE